MQSILDDATTVPDPGETDLPAITASERSSWAKMRNTHFRNGTNRTSLAKIESAAFVLVLDEYEYGYDKVRSGGRRVGKEYFGRSL